MQMCARLPSAPPLAAPGTSSRLSRAGDEHSTWSYLQRPGGLRQCTQPNLATNKLCCINQQLHLANLMQKTGQRWVLFKQIYHGEEDIAFTNSEFTVRYFPPGNLGGVSLPLRETSAGYTFPSRTWSQQTISNLFCPHFLRSFTWTPACLLPSNPRPSTTGNRREG